MAKGYNGSKEGQEGFCRKKVLWSEREEGRRKERWAESGQPS